MGSLVSQLSGSAIGAIEKLPSDAGKLKGQFLSRICQTPISDAINLKMIIEDIFCHQSYFKLGLTLGFGETA